MSSDKQVILAIDIGTTNLKCSLYDEKLRCFHSCSEKLVLIQEQEGHSELDPQYLLKTLKALIETCIQNKPKSYELKCLGISTQRNSMILWNKKTGRKYTNFIVWNDKRSADLASLLNSGIVLNTFKKASYLYTLFVRNHRLRTFSNYKVDTSLIPSKLLNELDILEKKLEPNELKEILAGNIETWLLWNITQEKVFATDVTCASCTGIYDMFYRQWSKLLGYLLEVPLSYFPNVFDTCCEFGTTKNDFISNLGYKVPITAVIADSQASVIGEAALRPGDCVITIGSGSFISVNVGSSPISSNNGLYPLACLKHKEKEMFILHSPCSSAGIAIDWAKSIGLFNNYNEIEELLNSIENSSGVFFISAFGFLDLPSVDKTKVQTGFIGLKQTTTRAHMFRSIIDSIAYCIKIKMDLMLKDLKFNNIPLRSIRISGGVSRSNFFCQYLSNLLEFPIERSNTSYTSSEYGAAYLAGLGAGLFNSVEDLEKLRHNVEVFKPDLRNKKFESHINEWENVLRRFL